MCQLLAQEGGGLASQLDIKDLALVIRMGLAYGEMFFNKTSTLIDPDMSQELENMLCYLILLREHPEYLPGNVPQPKDDIAYVELPENIEEFLDSLHSRRLQ